MSHILQILVEKSSMPRISEQLRKDLFLESLRRRVRRLYTFGESHPGEKKLIAAKLDGFLEAALMLRICSKDEAQRLIDEEHLAIFEMSRAERAEGRAYKGLADAPDWTPYEAPATERVTPKRRRARPFSATSRARSKHRANPKAVSEING